MRPKTEEFLNLLLWSAEMLTRPTFRNLTDSYESWAYRNGLLRQVATLQQQEFLERDARFPNDRLYQLAQQLRLTRVGTVSVDGTKIAANASKHAAVSYQRAGELITQLELEVQELVTRAEQADTQAPKEPSTCRTN